MKVVLEFTMDPDELQEILSEEDSLYDWVFAEICQNLGFGFLTAARTYPEDDE